MRRWIAPLFRALASRRPRPLARHARPPRPTRLELTEMERRDLMTVFSVMASGPTSGVEGSMSATVCIYFSSFTGPGDPRVITFDYAVVSGTALAGSDVPAVSGTATLNWANPGFPLTVTVTDDILPEPTETFSIRVSNSSGGTPDQDEVVFTIYDDDPKIPTTTALTVDPGAAVIEGQVFELEAAVTASVGNPPGAVTFTATNTATLAVYALGAGTLGTDLHPGEDDDLWEAELLQTGRLPVGTYTLTATYPGTDLYDGSSGTATLTVAAAPAAPTAPASCDGPVAADPGGGTATAQRTAGGVQPGSGAVQLTQTALKSGGAGLPLAQTVSWSNAAGVLNSFAGNGTVQTWQPQLVALNGGAVVGLATAGADALLFDLYDGIYHSRWGGAGRLTRNPGAGRYTLTDAGGSTFTFYDFSPSTPAGRAGRVVSMADRAGTVTEVVAWTGDGKPAEVQTTTGSGGSAQTESYVYAYHSGGAADGLLASVTQRRRTGAGAWATVGGVAYTYHDGTTAAGRAGDLRTAAVSDAVGVTDTTYYRSYTAAGSGGGSGAVALVKFAFGPGAYARLTAALGTGVDALTDAQVDDYADNFFAYDAQDRVTTAVVAGTGCSVCSGGLGTYTYSYAANPSPGGAAGPNTWAVRTTETRPDGTVAAYYTNAAGQTMLTAVTAGGQTWVEYNRYDDAGRLVLTAAPSAVSGYDDGYGDLVRYTSGNAQYLRDGEGLLTAYTYGSSTTATTTTAGDVAGYQKSADLLRGETGTLVNGRLVPQAAWTYLVTPTAIYVSATSTVYRNADGTGAQTTTRSYTWQGSTAQPASVTVTLPVVSAAQNGSGAATAATTVYDALGRPVWAKDQAGFLTYMEYDPATGAVVQTITDVDTTQAGTFTGLPSGWATPTGGGLHRTASFEVDAKGRVTKATYPGGRVDYTVYDDVAHETRYYPAWNTTTNAPTGPTTVTRDDRARGYTETLTMSAAPAVSGGRPTGAEAISGVLTLSRSSVNAVGQVVSTDAYFDLTGLTYSTSASLGTEGVNFDRTRYGYTHQGWQNKVVSPQGTITRTEYDGLGRAVTEWVGTDDTPTTGVWSPANLAGTNMVKVREYEYDGGGVGDGNLTRVTEYPGLSAPARVTQTWFDWRGRAVATKGGVEASESSAVNRPLTYVDYDNLGQVVRTRVYDGDGLTVADRNGDGVPDALAGGTGAFGVGGVSGTAVGRSVTVADAAGNVYVSGRFSGTVDFDPGAGTVTRSAAGVSDVFVAKYAPDGSLVWVACAGGAGANLDGSGLAVDAAGGVYMTGVFSGSAGFGGTTLTSAGGQDTFVWKLDGAGATAWAVRGGGTGDDPTRRVAVDAAGGVYVTGYFSGTAGFGGVTLTSAGGNDAYVWKLDGAGATAWAVRGGGTGSDLASGVAVDAAGGVYVTGGFSGTAGFGGVTLTSAGGNDAYVWKLDGSGATTWAVRGGGTDSDGGGPLVVDAAGGVYVTGGFSGSAGFGGVTLTSAGGQDAYVWKLDGSGATTWAVRGGGTGLDIVGAVAMDAAGGVYVTGVFSGSAGFGGAALTSAGGNDAYVWKLDGSGATTWAVRGGGTDSDVAGAVAVGADGAVYVAGYFLGTAGFGGTTLTAAGPIGMFVWHAHSALRAQTTFSYDDLGRAYRTDTSSVDPTTGAVGTSTLNTQVWYDARGLVIKTAAPGGLVTKTTYDGIGRVRVVSTSDGGGDTGYADADDVTGDIVLQQVEVTYDAAGRVVRTTTRQRNHDETGTGSLTSLAARVSYVGYYYDLADRPIATVDIGTSPGTVYAWPSTPPASTASVLVSTTSYDAAGRVYETTDPLGRVARTTYDALGRVVKTVENYVDGVVSDGDDKTTEYTYNAAGMTSLTARLTGGGGQTTQWVYGVTTAGGSGVNSNDMVGATRWPDATTGAASGSEQEVVTVNALGQLVTHTDRNGTTHSYIYDVLGRRTTDVVTTLGSGVDGAVRRIEYAYDGQGNAYRVTSYSAAVGGSVVNQVLREYNGLGQLTAEWQEHAGEVDTETVVDAYTTPVVRYGYSLMAGGANHSRLTSVTYPSGYSVGYGYSSGLDSSISRLSALTDTSGTLEAYSYLGLGTVVVRSHPQPDLDLTYVKRAGEPNGDAGDQYTGLDRFGRVVDQRWVDGSSGVATDRFQYGYDRAGNRLYRDNLVNATFGEVYTYDGLDQLASFDRGTLNGTKTGVSGSPSRSQDWNYDAVGNWDGIDVDGVTQTRTANAQNEITSVGGATTPGYDANGNMTQAETGLRYVYDAWNRLVAVKNSAGTTTLKTFTYDGANRRATAAAGGATTDLFYSAEWQVLEERVAGATTQRYVWSPVYVDALVLRDRDTDTNGSLDERLWVTQDANWNVTALVDGTGAVVERYAYDPFGTVTMLTPSFGSRSVSSYGWTQGFQGMFFDSVAGLSDQRARWYSPTLGRWASVDPIRFAGGDVNLYGFVGENPVNQLDPSGLASELALFNAMFDFLVASGADEAAARDFARTFARSTVNQIGVGPASDRIVTNLGQQTANLRAMTTFNRLIAQQRLAEFNRLIAEQEAAAARAAARAATARAACRLGAGGLLFGGMVYLAGQAPPSPAPDALRISRVNETTATVEIWELPDRSRIRRVIDANGNTTDTPIGNGK